MIDWKYEEFYNWYKNNYGTLEDDGTLMKIIHLKRYNKKYKLENFVHDKKDIIVAKLNELTTVQQYQNKFPFGMYVLFNKSQKDTDMMRLYFVFPSYKGNNEIDGDVELIADHYTFLLSLDENDKRPVKTHITLYNPSAFTIKQGNIDYATAYMPKAFQIVSDGYQPNVFEKFGPVMGNVGMDIIKKPYTDTKNTSGGGPSRNLKMTNKTKAKKLYPTISAGLNRLLLKHNVIEVKAIGIKLKNQRKYTYTTFITFELDKESNTDNDEDSIDYSQPIPSFVFQENGTYKSFEKTLIMKIREWSGSN
jgi:hypothetical protein